MDIRINGIMKFRSRILEGLKRVKIENPDKLNKAELNALINKIFKSIDDIDMAFREEHHNTELQKPANIPKWKEEELFNNFIDWYNIIPTGATLINGYVNSNYPQSQYRKVICVGDGEYCHLGRKLASRGYDVVVVDPVSKKEFAMQDSDNHGKLHIVNGGFFNTPKSMIDWADIIVGAKVPLCAEDLTKMSKPTVFSISNSPKIHNMRYNGGLITSAEQLRVEIEKTPGVKRINFEDYLGYKSHIYVCHNKDKDDMDEYAI